MRLPVLAFAGWCLALSVPAARADVTVKQDGDIYSLDNARMHCEVDSAAGGRVRSWVLKPSGRDLIALWKGAGEIGGALDDRAFFTSTRYRAAIMQPGPETGVLRLEATHSSGLSVVKILTVRRDSAALRVDYEWRNGTQAPQRLFIRNFLLPGNQPQTDDHPYWVNGEPERGDRIIGGTPDASGYYRPKEPEYAALWDRGTGDGVLVYAPGVDRFYFWRGSREFPTFEWIYDDIPAGQVLRASVVLVAVAGAGETPDWETLVAANQAGLRRRSLAALDGWVDEATRFGITEAERERGFWLSIGEDEGKQRLTDPLELDLPLDEDRYVSITLNLLRDLREPVRIGVPEAWADGLSAYWDTPGEDRRELLPVPDGPIDLKAGGRENLWLNVRAGGRPAGKYRVPLELRVGERAMPVDLAVHVWPVKVAAQRPFHVRGYCGGFPVWAGGYEIDDGKLQHLEAILKAFAEIGGDVLDWNGVWARMIPHVKIADTGGILGDVAKNEPTRIDLAALPRLDFSYYDPWFELAQRYGVTRLETHMLHPNHSKLSWYLLDPAVGKGRVQRGTPQAEQVLAWFFGEMKRHLEERGFHGFFCKISDEIAPEEIPTHIETAKVVRQAGWRPFTTITGMIARTAAHINTMDPYCDQWQLAFSLKDDFLTLRERKFRTVEEDHEVTGTWGKYTNGGAVDTWGMRVFDEGGPVPLDPGQVEQFELLEDGKPMRTKGGSPWGNKERGVVITGGRLHEYLYVSPFTGSPEEHHYELKLRLRRDDPNGSPLVALDPTDEVWCYGGGSSPFRAPYHRGYVYPIMTLYHDFDGYGLWAFYHWNKTERIMWIDEPTNEVTISPVYCGYRDGWRDALLFSQVIERAGREQFDRIVGDAQSCPLRVGAESREVYTYSTLKNANDPVAVNAARRRALEALSAG